MTALRHLPVTDLLGVTHNFEQLQGVLTEQERELRVLQSREAPKLPEAWKGVEALGFTNAWKNLEVGRKAEYRKNPFGTVELRGVITAGESLKAAFTLPVGYRPKNNESLAVIASGGLGEIRVETTGVVTPVNIGAGAEVKAFVFLEPGIFSVE